MVLVGLLRLDGMNLPFLRSHRSETFLCFLEQAFILYFGVRDFVWLQPAVLEQLPLLAQLFPLLLVHVDFHFKAVFLQFELVCLPLVGSHLSPENVEKICCVMMLLASDFESNIRSLDESRWMQPLMLKRIRKQKSVKYLIIACRSIFTLNILFLFASNT